MADPPLLCGFLFLLSSSLSPVQSQFKKSPELLMDEETLLGCQFGVDVLGGLPHHPIGPRLHQEKIFALSEDGIK